MELEDEDEEMQQVQPDLEPHMTLASTLQSLRRSTRH